MSRHEDNGIDSFLGQSASTPTTRPTGQMWFLHVFEKAQQAVWLQMTSYSRSCGTWRRQAPQCKMLPPGLTEYGESWHVILAQANSTCWRLSPAGASKKYAEATELKKLRSRCSATYRSSSSRPGGTKRPNGSTYKLAVWEHLFSAKAHGTHLGWSYVGEREAGAVWMNGAAHRHVGETLHTLLQLNSSLREVKLIPQGFSHVPHDILLGRSLNKSETSEAPAATDRHAKAYSTVGASYGLYK